MKRWLDRAVFAAILAAAAPALAGQSGPSDDLSAALPPPADRGRPMIYVPPDIGTTGPGAARASGCVPALPCGTHLYGAVQKNGAVTIEVPALRW